MRCELLRGAIGLSAFTPAVASWLARDPVRHNHLCTVVSQRADGVLPTEPDALWALIRAAPGTPPAWIAAWTPPHLLLVPELDDEAASALVDALLEAGETVPGVTGMAPGPSAVARAWTARTTASARRGMSTRLLVLETLRAPDDVPGRLIRADWTYRPWLIKAVLGFEADTPGDEPEPFTERDAARRVDYFLSGGRAWLWEVRGEPVAMVCFAPPAAAAYRINAVYTPPEHRRRGYAAAATAELSQHLLDIGAAAVLLFTDAANPTSNGVYERIGYRAVAEGETWTFTPS
ncbi:GNAT family N-acetyltransferase [Cryptosporangium arvum]|uniref:Putative acyltransferase n=1 Tax=Cryptosporangium arvum DSM 44712 TaxID=927661 RepID=A0A010ZNW5_9ACTN|nr:GNAT family N-acetyltransferase [Cryptosporangium arvum]EXG80374.1 putative acyltransferase [Cryptosporangium arvum DSM 44712]